jgi:hypothetical protein
VRRIHWHTAELENEKTNNSEVIKVKRIAFLISLIILSDLSTIRGVGSIKRLGGGAPASRGTLGY